MWICICRKCDFGDLIRHPLLFCWLLLQFSRQMKLTLFSTVRGGGVMHKIQKNKHRTNKERESFLHTPPIDQCFLVEPTPPPVGALIIREWSSGKKNRHKKQQQIILKNNNNTNNKKGGPGEPIMLLSVSTPASFLKTAQTPDSLISTWEEKLTTKLILRDSKASYQPTGVGPPKKSLYGGLVFSNRYAHSFRYLESNYR